MSISLIVGLSNPGKEYADTRHNAGAWFVEKLAQAVKKNLRHEAKYQAAHAIVTLHGQTCHLLIPATFMNLSGTAVLACMKYYKITPAHILIAHDDIDLPPGEIKLKFDGGDGGHNGLKDIISKLHTKQFYRLRIGVGRPRGETIDYVLSPPSKSQRQAIDDCIVRAEEILPLLMDGEMQKAMQRLHTKQSE